MRSPSSALTSSAVAASGYHILSRDQKGAVRRTAAIRVGRRCRQRPDGYAAPWSRWVLLSRFAPRMSGSPRKPTMRRLRCLRSFSIADWPSQCALAPAPRVGYVVTARWAASGVFQVGPGCRCRIGRGCGVGLGWVRTWRTSKSPSPATTIGAFGMCAPARITMVATGGQGAGQFDGSGPHPPSEQRPRTGRLACAVHHASRNHPRLATIGGWPVSPQSQLGTGVRNCGSDQVGPFAPWSPDSGSRRQSRRMSPPE